MDLPLINLALGHLGEPALSQAQLDQDPPDPKAAKVRAIYPEAVLTAQARAPWLCCMDYASLPEAADLPTNWKYPFVHRLPDAALHVWSVNGMPEGVAWAQGVVTTGGGGVVKVIRSQLGGPLNVEFTRDTPTAGWDPLLRDAFGYELASRLAGPLQADAQTGVRMGQLAERAYQAARGSEAGRSGGQDALYSPGPVAAARRAAL